MAEEIFVNLPSGISTYVMTAAQAAGGKILIDNYTEYDVRYCGDYGIYYLNLYGGWDCFLFEGRCKRTDNLTVSDYEKTAAANDLSYATTRYMVENQRTWALNTGWLTDSEAETLAKHLFSSPKVYLHDLDNDEIIPVLITDTAVEYKKFKNSNRLNKYTVNVKASKIRMRR